MQNTHTLEIQTLNETINDIQEIMNDLKAERTKQYVALYNSGIITMQDMKNQFEDRLENTIYERLAENFNYYCEETYGDIYKSTHYRWTVNQWDDLGEIAWAILDADKSYEILYNNDKERDILEKFCTTNDITDEEAIDTLNDILEDIKEKTDDYAASEFICAEYEDTLELYLEENLEEYLNILMDERGTEILQRAENQKMPVAG